LRLESDAFGDDALAYGHQIRFHFDKFVIENLAARLPARRERKSSM
jgi:hypothetical protein